MHRLLIGSLALLFLLPALLAQDKPAKDHSTTSGGYQALMDEYRKALKESDRVFDKARTDDERAQVRARFAKFRSQSIDRLLDFIEKNPKDEDALLALFFVLHPDIFAEPRAIDKAVQLILKDHIRSDRLTNPPILQMAEDSPAAERLMRGVLEQNPHPPIQAQASLRLGQIVKRKASAAPPEQAANLREEAEALFERVVDKYSEVKDVGERASAELFEMQNLVVGKLLPDIKGKDSDGKELNLSDYRGKVVVVNFWAEWCAPCMKMVPHERALVKRLQGKPFALVGVNRNESRESLKACEQKHQITWRSFFDGTEGRISTGHNIRKMPTIYVLDAAGFIRYINIHGEALDKAVDQLIAEMEKRPAK